MQGLRAGQDDAQSADADQGFRAHGQ
jgi:hypothetical protein